MDGTLPCNSLPLSHCQLKHFSLPLGFSPLVPPSPPRTHQACSEMLYFEERVQRETFKPIRPNHRPIFLLLFSPLNWGFLRIGAHPHPRGQSHLPGAQWGNTTTRAPATPLGTLPWSCSGTVNRQPPVTSQPVRPT